MSLSLDSINVLAAEEFVRVFGAVYEHSPWVAEQAQLSRPFASFEQMGEVMKSQVAAASRDKQLALIRAHPELQGKPATNLTMDSRSEQKSAGLDQCTPQEIEQLASLNRAYRQKFDFPFVIAVRGLTRADIIASMNQRLENDDDVEFHSCMQQIHRIAALRIAALVQ